MSPQEVLQLKPKTDHVWLDDLYCTVLAVRGVYQGPNEAAIVSLNSKVAAYVYKAPWIGPAAFWTLIKVGVIMLRTDRWIGTWTGRTKLTTAYLDLEYHCLDQELNYYAEYLSVSCNQVSLQEPKD